MDSASLTFAPLLESAALPRNPQPYSCSRTTALRYQIVSSLPRQALLRAAVRFLRSLCARRARIRREASPRHPFANRRRAVRALTPSAQKRPAPYFVPHARKEEPAIRV